MAPPVVPALRPPPALPPPPKLPAEPPPLEPMLPLLPNEPLDWVVVLLLGEESNVEVRLLLGGGEVLRFTLLLVAVLLFTFVFDGVELILLLLWLVEVLPSLTLPLGLV